MMIQCRECGKEISDKAIKCPQCGCPVKKSQYVSKRGIYLIAAIACVLVIFFTIRMMLPSHRILGGWYQVDDRNDFIYFYDDGRVICGQYDYKGYSGYSLFEQECGTWRIEDGNLVMSLRTGEEIYEFEIDGDTMYMNYYGESKRWKNIRDKKLKDLVD